jgi:ribosome biogenesis GTPase
VELKKDDFSSNYVITKVLPRKNELIRPKVTNIDQLLIVISALPKPDLYLVDKLIVNAILNNIKPILVLNKVDLLQQSEIDAYVNEFSPVVEKIILTSALNNKNISELKEVLQDKTSVFAGQSAVGKSSLLNAIDDSINQATNILSKKVERGKHTTRECTIFVLDKNILIADTPGFSMLELNMKHSDLASYYPEFADYTCKFANCSHTNEQHCNVKNAVELGEINKDRYSRYLEHFKQLKTKWDKQYD